jgi:hypothetical protein
MSLEALSQVKISISMILGVCLLADIKGLRKGAEEHNAQLLIPKPILHIPFRRIAYPICKDYKKNCTKRLVVVQKIFYMDKRIRSTKG